MKILPMYVFGVLSLLTQPVSAALVTYQFDAVLFSKQHNEIWTDLSQGDALDGEFTLDTNAVVLSANPGFRVFGGDFDLTIEGISYLVTSVTLRSTTLNINFNAVDGAFLQLRSNSIVFSDITKIPALLPSLESFDRSALLSVRDRQIFGREAFNEAILTSLSNQSTGLPAPGAGMLLGIGLMVLAARRRASLRATHRFRKKPRFGETRAGFFFA